MAKTPKPEPETTPVPVTEEPESVDDKSTAELALDLHRAETDARIEELKATSEQELRKLKEQHAEELRRIHEHIDHAQERNDRKLAATADDLQAAHRRSLEIRESGAASEAARAEAAAKYNVSGQRALSYPPKPGPLENMLIAQWKRRNASYCSDPKCYYPLTKLLTPEANYVAQSVEYKGGRAFKAVCSWDPMHGQGEVTANGRIQFISIPEKKDEKQ